MSEITLEDKIYSQDYVDLILPFQIPSAEFLETFQNLGAQLLDGKYGLIHVERSAFGRNLLAGLAYTTLPKLFTTLDTTSLEVSGILRTQNQPILNLKGENVIIGFVDTGIDYTLDAFRDLDGRTRILSIWDQTAAEGIPPPNMLYGNEYTKEDIDRALTSDNPLEVVPSTDDNGHGTFMAGVAGGSENVGAGFIGAAPKCDIAMVKLKPAKQYLKNFFFVPEDATAFQESDIILGINYLLALAQRAGKPIVICLGVGTNQGAHAGSSPLEEILSSYSYYQGIYFVVAGGNEAGKSHHYYGRIPKERTYEDVEILVEPDTKGFTIELWGQAPELFSVAITSPLGETIPQVPARIGQSTVENFVLEKTIVYIDYEIVEFATGSQLILIRFEAPTPGLWTIRVFNSLVIEGSFHIWLPITGLIPPGTVFLSPNPDTTLTTPSTAEPVITISTYNAYTGGLFIHSSRGYTRTGFIKPDIAAPGVDVTGPAANNRYVTRTGSSMAAAITAGAVALLANWGLTLAKPRYFNSAEAKNYLIRGANRSPNNLYPNREWGYGTLDLYRIFEAIR